MVLEFSFGMVFDVVMTLFKTRYPELFLITRNRDTITADNMDVSTSNVLWNPSSIRAVQDWELESMEFFLDDLYATKDRMGEEDRMIRTPFESQGFRVSY
jgi:hypothetical protein